MVSVKQMRFVDYPSISFSQDEILRMIVDLHCPLGIEADVTYGNGCFWDGSKPRYRSDLKATGNIIADCCRLPYPNGSLQSLVFDPPFLHKSGEGSMIKERYGDFPSIPLLWEFYRRALREFGRVLKPTGIVVFKCQDTVSCGKNWFSHIEIVNYAKDAGLILKDLFILLAKSRMPQWNRKTYQHARKYHSYFLVFRKTAS